METEILIDGNLYEVHCKLCDEILAILERIAGQTRSHDYLCDNCAIIENNRRVQEQEEALAKMLPK